MGILEVSARLKVRPGQFAEDHTVYMFGDVSPKLREIVNVRLAGKVKAHMYSFLQGLEPEMTLVSAEA